MLNESAYTKQIFALRSHCFQSLSPWGHFPSDFHVAKSSGFQISVVSDTIDGFFVLEDFLHLASKTILY